MAVTVCGRQLSCVYLLVPHLSAERSTMGRRLREIKREREGAGEGDGVSDRGGGRDKHVGGDEEEGEREARDVYFGYK